jgi:hypothetical protein
LIEGIVIMVTAQDLQTKFNQPHSGKGPRSARPDHGKVFPIIGPNRHTLDRIVVNHVASYAMVDAANQCHEIITETQAAQDMTQLENLSFSNHTAVKNDDRWRHLYHRAQRNFKFMNDQGAILRQSLWSYPCHYCGFVLPEQFVEVDHRQPQAHPGVAAIKALHALGGAYTTQPAHGTKGTQTAAIAAASTNQAINGLTQVPVNGWNWTVAWQGNAAALTQAKRARYTLTDAGKTFLSVCSMYWGLIATEKKCLNNF